MTSSWHGSTHEGMHVDACGYAMPTNEYYLGTMTIMYPVIGIRTRLYGNKCINRRAIYDHISIANHKVTQKCRSKWSCILTIWPLLWASVHWLVQCTLECHWNTPGGPSVHWDTTGPPSEYLQGTLEHHWNNLVESAPRWDATWETVTFTAYTGTPLEGLWQPTHAPTYIVKHAE